jgi:hypothetical protein
MTWATLILFPEQIVVMHWVYKDTKNTFKVGITRYCRNFQNLAAFGIDLQTISVTTRCIRMMNMKLSKPMAE